MEAPPMCLATFKKSNFSNYTVKACAHESCNAISETERASNLVLNDT